MVPPRVNIDEIKKKSPSKSDPDDSEEDHIRMEEKNSK